VAVVKKPARRVAQASSLVRPWRGVSPEQRVAERRSRLLDAALEVFVARTFHGAKVRDVCQEAGLTERYFYESFADKEALLMALAVQIVSDFVAAAGPSIERAEDDLEAAIDGAMRAVVSSLIDDPRRARILFVEVVGVSPRIEDERRTVIRSLVEVIRAAVARAYGAWAIESVEVELIARSVIGAASELLVSYVRDELPLNQEELVVNLKRLFMRAGPILTAMTDEHLQPSPTTQIRRR
jgi:AcrR family transcriptional regulator